MLYFTPADVPNKQAACVEDEENQLINSSSEGENRNTDQSKNKKIRLLLEIVTFSLYLFKLLLNDHDLHMIQG